MFSTDNIMSVIKNKLELVAQVTYEALLQIGIIEKIGNNDSNKDNDQTSKGIIKIKVNSSSPTMRSIDIVVIELTKDSKCMISLCDERDNTLASHIFKYDGNDDNGLGLNNTEFPLNWEQFRNEHEEQVTRLINIIINDLRLQSMFLSTDRSDITNKNDSDPLKINATPIKSTSTKLGNVSHSKNSNVDIPKFEDEYEINEPSGSSRLGELPGRYFPVRGGPTYGNKDLYPMGEKNPLGPNLGPFGPSSNSRNDGDTNSGQSLPGQGGMIFDPFGQNRDEMFRDKQNRRGPGWIPGSKYDDPFGTSGGFDGMGGPRFPGSGSGSGSGSGFGFL